MYNFLQEHVSSKVFYDQKEGKVEPNRCILRLSHTNFDICGFSCLPFDAGFEAVGIIAAVGDSITDLKVGMPCAFMTFGGYAEFLMFPSKHALPVPRPDPKVVTMLTSGLTTSISLEKVD
ncbi:probable quinone oxidoreductase [Glycine soja]|uniref:probable quinone oxidoreductase n=1 Tax=Glycine soja TaxID=3848 RepID=UPI0010390503|nr:probable quinone oxidoreductase [Glycine soja]